MGDWRDDVKRLREEGKSWTETAKIVMRRGYPDMDGLGETQVIRRCRHVIAGAAQRGNVTFEDKKEITDTDVDAYFNQLKALNAAAMNLEQKQTRANISIADDKPVGIAFWSDWHVGAKGINYEQLDADTELIAQTDGLHVFGLGDYKDNASALVHANSTLETIAPTDMQDMIVQRIFKRTAGRHCITIRGCHDDWDKRNANKDFVQSICDITGAVNLWHGGIVNLSVGDEEYRIGARHKFKFESNLNTTNSQRNFINENGHCDIVAVAHKHYCEIQDTRRMGQETIYLRSGSYKQYDEFGQKLAGYEGIYGVPVVILYPDRHYMMPVQDLRKAVEMLNELRK